MLTYREILKKLRPPQRKPRVWLLEKEKAGYIRIRKVASSSINLSLMQHLAKSNKLQDPTDDRSLRKAIEARYSSHIAHSVIRRDLKGKYFLFAFVRNPLSRAWSGYRNKVINPKRAGKKEVLSNREFYYGMDFTEFVDVLVKLPDDIVDRHLRSQSWFLCDEQGLLPDYIGKLETFDKDWEFVSHRYGLPTPIHWNKTGTPGKLTDICPRASLEKLIDRYADDIEIFGYQQAVDDMLQQYQTTVSR
jgi:hypothetical protein